MGQTIGTSIVNTAPLGVKNSLFHAHYCKLLEMCAYDYLSFLQEASCENPFIEVDERCEAYALEDDQLAFLEERGELSFNHHESPDRICEAYRESVDNQADNPQGACEDFTDSLHLYLRIQMPAFQEKGKSPIFEALIEFIDDRGFLVDDPDFIAHLMGFEIEEVLEVLEAIRCIDPGGIGSRGIMDFLWYQCQRMGWDTPVMHRAVCELLEYVADGNITGLRRELDISARSVREMIERVRSFRPYPTWGMDISYGPIAPREPILYPDFALYQLSGGDCVLWVIEPRVTFSPISQGREGTENDAPSDIRMEDMEDIPNWRSKVDCLEREAYDLLGMADRRKKTVLRVVSLVVVRQKAYLLRERDYKEPLNLSQIGSSLGLSVSTVSRAMKDRYISSPRGILSLKDLLARPFPGAIDDGISQDYIVRKIESLSRSSKGKAMSDSKIARILESDGIDIARRTVNKYRKSLERPAVPWR